MAGRLRNSVLPTLVAGALLAGVAAARYEAAAAVRRRRIAAGDLRELDEMWTWVENACWHARFSTPPGERDAHAVVLVHGFGVSSRYFVPFAERLAVFSDVYAPDLPGHGKTEPPVVPLDVGGFAAALARWLDVMRLSHVRMVGHSMGCQIAVELALRRPDLVERLVLIGPTIDCNARSLRATLPRFVAGSLHEPPRIGVVLVKDYVQALRALPTEIRSMFSYRLENAVGAVGDMPLLLVRGEHDKVAPVAWLDVLRRRAANARVAVVPRAAHAAQFGEPDELVRLVRPFLAEATAVREEIHQAS
jgi:pimeloyl-ACP methyl ester carboxylesterase